MTLEDARDTARNAAIRFGKPFVVFRMPGFTPGHVAVIAEDRGLPPNAELLETITATREVGAVTVREVPAAAQGSLF